MRAECVCRACRYLREEDAGRDAKFYRCGVTGRVVEHAPLCAKWPSTPLWRCPAASIRKELHSMERRHKWEPGERVLAVCTGTWHYGVGVIRSGPDKNNRYVVEFDRDGLRSGCRVIGRPCWPARRNITAAARPRSARPENERRTYEILQGV